MVTTFKLDSENAGVVLMENEDENGFVVRRTLTDEGFLTLIAKAQMDLGISDGKKEYIYNPPAGCKSLEHIKGLYMGMKEADGSFGAVFFMSEYVGPLKYTNDVFIVPFPSIIFYFRSKSSKMVETKIFATKIKNIEELRSDTLLYNFPFGNVHSEGSCCWGSVVLDDINSITDFQKIIRKFYNSTVNSELYSYGKNVVGDALFEAQRKLLEYLQDKETFPDEILVPSKYTLSDFEKILI